MSIRFYSIFICFLLSIKFSFAEITIEAPTNYEDATQIATHLLENKPVIVNLKNLENDISKRLIDFVCGTAYAINGHMMKIGDTIFLFTSAPSIF